MNETPKERLRKSVDDRPLPLDQDNGSLVFLTGPVLRKEAGPVFRIRADVYTTRPTHLADSVGEDLRHRHGALGHEGRIRATATDPEPVDPSGVPRDVPVTEIETQEIRVGSGWNVLGGSAADHARG